MKKFLSILLVLVFSLTFVDASFAELILPESITVIDSEAFANCEDAQILTIYNSNATIADDALTGSGVHTIRCYSDATQIIAFANQHNIDVEYLDAAPSVTIWFSGNVTNLTASQVAAFKAAYPQYADVTINIVEKSEGDAVSDIQESSVQPDIFGFSQDQLVGLKNMGKLDPVPNPGAIRNRNVAGSVSAAEIGGTLYAYPMTADNGYFLYYDKSVVTDPSSMESILASCEAAGKKFYMEINSGWYQVSYFFGAGCTLEFAVSDSGTFESVNIDYANVNGVKAVKSLSKTLGSPAFVNGSSVDEASNWAAIVSGTWDSEGAKAYLGNNFAASKLPTIDGYQMKSYGGFKLLGVTPQEDSDKRTLCHALADWLTNENCQLDRFEEAGWGPSNIAAQQSEAVQGDSVLTALAEQAAYAVPQGPIHGGYWLLASTLILEITSGQFDIEDDDAILARLVQFENDVRALLAPQPVLSADVGISLPTDLADRWVMDGNVMRDYLEDAEIDVDLRYANNNVATQQDQIDEMIDEGVQVLIIAPVDSTSLGTQMARAKDLGIQVISYDRLIMNSDAVSYYTTFDNYLVGYVQGKYIRDALNLNNTAGPYNLEITAGDPGDGNAAEFYRGAMDVLGQYIQDGILVVKSGQVDFADVATQGWSPEIAAARADEIITTYHEADTIHAWLCSNDSTASGVIESLLEDYHKDWPIITGQDCDTDNVKMIIRGLQAMSVLKDTRVLAAQAAKMATQIIDGEYVDVNDNTNYHNGAKYIYSFLVAPDYVDASNYYAKLIESGLMPEEWLQ